MPGALEGIRIVEWAQFINGPSATCMLGDLGAEVIKIEHRVRGDASRGTAQLFGSAMSLPGGRAMGFESWNRNKKSVTLDLEKPEGKEILYRLVKKSDVFVTNFFKSVAVKNGADYETLRQHNSRIIYARSGALGDRGPKSDIRGFDFIGMAYSGMMSAMGDRDEPPALMVGAPTDQLASIVLAYGIVTALLTRERLGIAQEIDTSMLGAAMQLQFMNVSFACFRGEPLARHSRNKTKAPFSNFYKCADGKWIMLSEIQLEKFWPKVCRALGKPEMEKDPKFNSMQSRRNNAAELISILDQVLATKTVADWVRILGDEVGIACCPVNSMADLVNDPQVIANQYVTEFDHPTMGHVKALGFPVNFTKTPASVRSAAPEFGQHTEEVLLDLGGYTWEEVAKLREREVI